MTILSGAKVEINGVEFTPSEYTGPLFQPRSNGKRTIAQTIGELKVLTERVGCVHLVSFQKYYGLTPKFIAELQYCDKLMLNGQKLPRGCERKIAAVRERIARKLNPVHRIPVRIEFS